MLSRSPRDPTAILRRAFAPSLLAAGVLAACTSPPPTEPNDVPEQATDLDGLDWDVATFRSERVALRGLLVQGDDVDQYRVLDPATTPDRAEVEAFRGRICVTSGDGALDVRVIDAGENAEIASFDVERTRCAGWGRVVGEGPYRIVVRAADPEAGGARYDLVVTRVRNDLRYRGINAAGPWGTAHEYVSSGTPMPTEEFLEWAHGIHANWIAINVALHLDDYEDTSIEADGDPCREPSCHDFPTWTDEDLARMLDTLEAQGIHTALELSLWYDRLDTLVDAERRPLYDRWQLGCVDGSGPPRLDQWWVPCYNDGRPHDPACVGREGEYLAKHDTPHEAARDAFFASYRSQATHYASLAQEHGVDLLVLGMETDCLFRTRPGTMTMGYREQLSSMVAAVREVYDGDLSYQAHHANAREPGALDLWDDLGLDVVTVSGYYPLADHNPALRDGCGDVPDPDQVRLGWKGVFEDELVPLRQRYPDRPVVLIEFGVTDDVAAPCDPMVHDGAEYADREDALRGWQTQAMVLQQFFAVADEEADERGAPVVDGVFLWDIWMVDHADWFIGFFDVHGFTVRGKFAERVVADAF